MATEIKIPELGESITEATIVRWLKKPGDRVEAGDVLLELETEKTNVELPAPTSGVLASIDRGDGEDVKVGERIGAIEAGEAKAAKAAEAGEAAEPAKAPAEPAATPEKSEPAEPPPASAEPAQRMHSRPEPEVQPSAEVPVEMAAAAQTQTRAEGSSAQKPAPAQPRPEPPPEPRPQPSPERQPGEREERVRMSRRRRTIAERLVEAQRTAAMLTTFNEVDMSAVMRIRREFRDEFKERHGVGLGLSSFFVRAAASALREFPEVNSQLDGDEIVYKYYYDIGMAVDTPEGLVVPVVRNADQLGFAEIERAVRELAERARAGKLGVEELRGGTFTITNGGVFGSLLSTPLLNLPQVAILGLHRIQDRPVAIDGQVQVRPMMYMALSYDHRIIDGRQAVQFLARIKDLVEDPQRLLVGL